jgi:hypothetical protein
VRKEELAERGLVSGSTRTGLENIFSFLNRSEDEVFFSTGLESCPLGLKQVVRDWVSCKLLCSCLILVMPLGTAGLFDVMRAREKSHVSKL